MIDIHEGALFISDAHDNVTREAFYRFLCAIDEGEIETTQLFLMGDMFDLLIGEVDYTHRHYRKSIERLDRLSRKIEIHYIEGNHDFNLGSLFPHLRRYPIARQPIRCTFHGKKILLSHGDWCEGPRYRLYAAIIRNPLLLRLLDLIDRMRGNRISKSILKKQQHKYICRKIPDFYAYIKQKIEKYDIGISKIDFVCEGHYHQNVEYRFAGTTYKNFASFACEKCYYRITFEDKVVFKELCLRG